MKLTIIKILLLTLIIPSISTSHATSKEKNISKFIQQMHDKHRFNKKELKQVLDQAVHKKNIIKAISRPAESVMTWHRYRKIFLRQDRIQGGVDFWNANEKALNRAYKKYGIPPEIIVAIIGVETKYGGNTGSFRILDALYTLGFGYPKRSRFFKKELKHFLLLTRKEKLNPTIPTGSYAGAMGVPQFMPSSYREYAIDFDNDGKRDIWNNTTDTIGSVANYFAVHGWKKNSKDIAYLATTKGKKYKKVLHKKLKPKKTLKTILQHNVKIKPTINTAQKAKLTVFRQKDNDEFWVTFHNFYVITRYNISSLYAMAVFQLSEEIKTKKELDKLEDPL
ncbi:MAG: lytic murein transglycosylase B [Methylococcales bacterium]|jgi:membrane-bound lytic murein transglycosylase B|nr:lytic murein transglycosylase B [Methylococcales bacterium]MBT7409846.1 lytic murein transglycosylase B [Methylococcales bacterium]